MIDLFKPSATTLSCVEQFLYLSHYLNKGENYKFYKYVTRISICLTTIYFVSVKCYDTLTKACLRCNIKLTKLKENIPQPHSSHQQWMCASGVGSKPNAPQNPLNDDDLFIIQPGFAATFSFWCMFPSVVCSFLLFFEF